jgi:hypothetical protein
VQHAHGQFGLVLVDQHLTLISLVEIAWMLMPRSASARNMVAATPAWLFMPTPTTLILATLPSVMMRL